MSGIAGAATGGPTPATFVGVSLKMYFDHEATLDWGRRVTAILKSRAVGVDCVEVVLLPSFPSLDELQAVTAESGVRIGAQNLASEDVGAFTGEVSGRSLVQVGCSFVEVGHAERRRLFGEDDAVVGEKLTAAFRNELVPILCVGEVERSDVGAAARECCAQLREGFARVPAEYADARVVVAYEPVWAIGEDEPATVDHIVAVCRAIRAWLDEHQPARPAQVVYGGSAGPGLLTALGSAVDGLFLGRFAHDPAMFGRILDEAMTRSSGRVA